LSYLVKSWEKVTEDPKLDIFIKYLREELMEKRINPNHKLVVFSESKETTNYLMEKLSSQGFEKMISINSENRKDKMPVIRENFDANFPLEKQKNDFNIVLTTEVLAEGVNLHRANVIVNYDTPWNSTRLMQRIGRVNRIGSTAEKVYIYNFFPTAKVENDIELEKKAKMKLQAFHSALGEDSQIYSQDEEVETFGLFDKDVDEEKDEKLFYLMEIRKFKEAFPERFKKISNMPLRARVGRKDRRSANCTLAFIRNNKRDAFFWVNAEGKTEELTFVETAKIFHANEIEKAISVHDKHHEQVEQALKSFVQKIQAEKIRDKVVNTQLGPNELKAISFLEGFQNNDLPNKDEQLWILKGMEAVRKGRFQQLQRQLNKLYNQQKKTPLNLAILLQEIMKILKSYPLHTVEEEVVEARIETVIMNPDIIISESFCN
jgi:superfamily II DNA/RNA helicase